MHNDSGYYDYYDEYTEYDRREGIGFTEGTINTAEMVLEAFKSGMSIADITNKLETLINDSKIDLEIANK